MMDSGGEASKTAKCYRNATHSTYIYEIPLTHLPPLLLINMAIYSLETLVGIWHGNFLSVVYLHWKEGKKWEAFSSLLKIELRGDEFLSLGPRYN